MVTELARAFARGIKPEQKLRIEEWARQNVFLADSKKSDRADLSLTPWLIEPLQTVLDRSAEDVALCAFTGAGKSTLLEILAAYTILEKPGPTGFFTQSGPTAQTWMETRLTPMLRSNPKILNLFPSDRHKTKRDQILFPHMPLYVRGPSRGNLQSLSLDGVILDECFCLDDGVIDFAKKRNHDRAFSYMLLVSQAGRTATDWFRWHASMRQKEYCGFCPSCREPMPLDFNFLLFNTKATPDDIKPVFVCPHCGAEHADKPETRRSIAAAGTYLDTPTAEPPHPNRIAYNVNALANWNIPWKTLALEFLFANKERKRGNFEPLEKFRNQRLSKWWDDSEMLVITPAKPSGGYSLSDRTKWTHTFLSVDVQGTADDTYFWFSVVTCDGSKFRLLDFGRFLRFEEIKAKAEEWGIPSNCVAIDSAYKKDEVQNFASIHNFLCLNGLQYDSFSVKDKNGKTYSRIYGKITPVRTTSGRTAYFAPYASQRVRTLFAALRSSGSWEIASDAPEHYFRQLEAETLTADNRWKQTGKDNHAIDLAAMTLILAQINKVPIAPSV